MRSVILLKDAETEFYEAIKYYNQERPGLGYEFAVQVDISIRRLEKWQGVSRNRWQVTPEYRVRCNTVAPHAGAWIETKEWAKRIPHACGDEPMSFTKGG